MQKVLISSCLLGEPVRYHGRPQAVEQEIIQRWMQEGRAVPVCPEVLGGLGVPRPPAEITGAGGYAVLDGFAVVLDERGKDLTRPFLEGAVEALQVAQASGVRVAVLKDGSPSCGRTYIHNGQFRGTRKRGEVGVAAALLLRNGIAVFSEHQLEAADRHLQSLEMNRKTRAAG